ncbi:MAG: GDP-mannose 4,6-dehydratase [Smithella sp.]|jgi:GDP-4-dehydro-6-deoxy-D-mannose reductase
MKKFLITGFSGFVSRYFIEYLEDNEIRAFVKGIDVHYPDINPDTFKHVKYDFERIDLLDKGKVENIIFEFQPDYVLHLASFSSVAFSWKEPNISFQNNTNIFLNLLETIRKLNIASRILSVGSSEEYGNVEQKDLPLTEDHPLKPVSPYAVARVSQELLSNIYVRGYGLDIVMTRSFNHIGPFQKDVFVLPSFVKQIVEMKYNGSKSNQLMTGDVTIIRDFTDVRDVASAYYMLLTTGKKGEVYNVCNGTGWSLKEIIEKISAILEIDVQVVSNASLFRPDDNRAIIGSNEKLRNSVNWAPKYSLEDTLNEMIAYWQKQIK